jgi:transcriptional regulator with XRE-family HTH domain
MNETLSQRLERLMAARGISAKALSLKANVNETAVRDIMKRTGNPTLRTLQSLADALGVDVAVLVSDVADLSLEEAEFIRRLRELNSGQRTLVRGVADGLMTEQNQAASSDDPA